MHTLLIVLILALILVALAFLFFAITILFKKNGRFPETHIGRNKNMKKMDIHCARTTDRIQRKNYKPVDINNNRL